MQPSHEPLILPRDSATILSRSSLVVSLIKMLIISNLFLIILIIFSNQLAFYTRLVYEEFPVYHISIQLAFSMCDWFMKSFQFMKYLSSLLSLCDNIMKSFRFIICLSNLLSICGGYIECFRDGVTRFA